MKKILSLMCLSVFLIGCNEEMSSQQTRRLSNVSKALSGIDQQHDIRRNVIVSPGSQPVKLESWRYSQPESTFKPRTIVIPGQNQNNSTYWQEKLAEDEWRDRNIYKKKR